MRSSGFRSGVEAGAEDCSLSLRDLLPQGGSQVLQTLWIPGWGCRKEAGVRGRLWAPWASAAGGASCAGHTGLSWCRPEMAWGCRSRWEEGWPGEPFGLLQVLGQGGDIPLCDPALPSQEGCTCWPGVRWRGGSRSSGEGIRGQAWLRGRALAELGPGPGLHTWQGTKKNRVRLDGRCPG